MKKQMCITIRASWKTFWRCVQTCDKKIIFLFDSLFYDAFLISRLYSVDDRVTSGWWWWIDKENVHVLSRIRTHGLSIQAIKSYASERTATGTGKKSIRACQLKRNYLKRSETCYLCLFCMLPLRKGECFQRYHTQLVLGDFMSSSQNF
jgi:hypothetical protein